MKIWIVNHYAIPPTSSGGTRHYNFAKKLQLLGHQVLIIAANYNHFSQNYILNQTPIRAVDYSHQVPFLWIPVPKYKKNGIARLWNMIVFMFRMMQKKYLPKDSPDIIIGSSPHLFAALGAKLIARRFKKPFVLEIRDIWPDTLVELGKFTNKHPLVKLMKLIELYLYKKSDGIISLLPCAHKYFIQHGVDQHKILSLPNSVDDLSILPSPLSDNKKFIFMYAGSHGLANHLDSVIEAAKILQEKDFENRIEIQLIGDGPAKEKLKDFVIKEKIKIVKFFDPLPKFKIYHKLAEADAFLMLLKKSPVFRWGISPNKLFDYLLVGKPIIFSVDTPFNLVKEANAGLSVQSGSITELVNAMESLAKLSISDLAKMGQNGRTYVLKHYHIETLTQQLILFLETILKVTKAETNFN